MTWRAGTKLGRTIYLNDTCVGMVDTPEMAREIVEALNAISRLKGYVEVPQATTVKDLLQVIVLQQYELRNLRKRTTSAQPPEKP